MTHLEIVLTCVLSLLVITLSQEVRLVHRKKELEEISRLLIDLVRVLDRKGVIEIVERGGEDE